MKLKHIVRFEPGYDCIEFKCAYESSRCIPGSGGSHGKHGLDIRFVAMGSAGAVQFVLYTGWLPQYTAPLSINSRWLDKKRYLTPIPADLGYHSMTPQYDEHSIASESCEFCGGKPCYYNGSALNASDAMYALVNGGDAALWKFLDGFYRCIFDGKEYPKPAEFKTTLRRLEVSAT